MTIHSDNLKKIVESPKPNFVLAFDAMGDNHPSLQFEFFVKKTLLARIKYWLLCKFFPFQVKRWV